MKKLKLSIGAIAIATIAFVACKKHVEVIQPNDPQNVSNVKQNDFIKQKNYNLSNEDLLSTISSFKGKNKNGEIQARTITTSSVLALDSSIWLIEAALNYDFDTQPAQGATTFMDSTLNQTNVLTATVSANDAETVYNYFNSYFTQKTSGVNKIKIIDIKAQLNATGLVYKANAVMFDNTESNRINTGNARCAGLPSNAAWAATDPGSCSSNASYADGPSVCTGFLNCNYVGNYSSSCNCGYYFINVTSVFAGNSGNSYPTMLYYNDIYSSCDNTILTNTQLSNYVSNIYSFAVTNTPTFPAGMVISNFNITSGVFYFSGSHLRTWWDLTVTYGTVKCYRCPA